MAEKVPEAAERGMDKPIFRELCGDDPNPEVTEVESFCVNCEKNGITRILLTKIPFYKEVVMMSFACDHCGLRNNELQSGGKVEEKGVCITLRVETERDLNRQVVKSDFTSVKIPELDFEIPAQSQKGEVTTVEGVINRAMTALEQDQIDRKTDHPDVAQQIETFVSKLKGIKDMKTPFTVMLRDISGNTYVENPHTPQSDAGSDVTYFTRSHDEDHLLGIYTQQEVDEVEGGEKKEGKEEKRTEGLMRPVAEGSFTLEHLHGEVHQFQTNCPYCRAPCETNMKMTNIPHFKEVVIMSTNCDACGQRCNEVKSGGGIEPKGLKIEVKVRGREDFSRDVLKSETCTLSIPELDMDVGGRALGGRFTTVEGLLTAMRDQTACHGTMFSDSADTEARGRMDTFLREFDEVLAGEKVVTLVLNDPAGNSYVQSLTYPETDTGLTITEYERTFDDNEDLGLNDMITEGYESH